MAAGSQGLGEFVEHLTAMESRMNQALGNPRVAGDVISELDADEGTFAHFTAVSGESRAELLDAYHLLDRMLGQIYETYRRKHDECLTAMGNGVECDYNTLEILELRALYPPSWLRFHGSKMFTSPEARRRILKDAMAGFTQSALVIVSPEMIRENLLGRAYCERDLGQFERSQYTKAIADFREVMKAGPGSAQYRAAQQGLATTYAAMGHVDEAAAITSHLSMSTVGCGEARRRDVPPAELFQRRRKPPIRGGVPSCIARRSACCAAITAAAGSGRWPWPPWFTTYPIRKRNSAPPSIPSSSTCWPKCWSRPIIRVRPRNITGLPRSGQYPQGYKYAIDIYYNEGKLDLIDAPLEELARERHSRDGGLGGLHAL